METTLIYVIVGGIVGAVLANVAYIFVFILVNKWMYRNRNK